MKAARSSKGFTLIELMITVAIIGILAAIALPSYRDYVIRGQLVNATTALSGARAKMEQYYQDNRTYAASNGYSPPCPTATSTPSSTTVGKFNVSCTIATGGAGYTITASGVAGSIVAGFTYTINQNNIQQTTTAPAGWNTSIAPTPITSTSPPTCWLVKKGTTC